MLLTYLCVVSDMGCDTDATRNWSWDWNRNAADGLLVGWLDLEGRMAGGDRLPFAQTHCNFGPGSADVADVVAKCPKMRNKHAHEFCNLPQPQVQVQRSAFSVHHQD